MKSLELLIFMFGINYKYPGIILAFFKPLLGLFNLDLLIFENKFDLNYNPGQQNSNMFEPYSSNMGWLGFETSSFILNLKSLNFLVALFVVIELTIYGFYTIVPRLNVVIKGIPKKKL